MKGRRYRTEPGEIVVDHFGMGKRRPWLVLWVDDVVGQVCLAAITSQSGYVGAVPTGHPQYCTVGAWVHVQPLTCVNGCQRAGVTFDAERRKRVRDALFNSLGLED